MLRKLAPLLLWLFLAGCPNAEPKGPDEYIADCETVASGQPAASDENYVKFVEAESSNKVTKDACKSPEITSPASGGVLDPRTPPTFSFRASHPVCTRLPLLRSGALGCRTAPGPSAPERLLTLAGSAIEGTAFAHCAAFTGENYLFRVTVAGQKTPVYSALLSVTSFTPNATAWSQALSGQSGKTVEISISRGVFLRGDLNEGPYLQPVPYSFTIGP